MSRIVLGCEHKKYVDTVLLFLAMMGLFACDTSDHISDMSDYIKDPNLEAAVRETI